MRKDGTDLSEESCLWSAKKVDGDDRPSTSVVSALHGLSVDGQVTEKQWPYGKPLFTSGPPPAAASPAGVEPGLSRELGRPSVTEIKAVLQGEAVILSVWVVGYAWFTASMDGLIDAPPGEPMTDLHAVLAVGVTSTSGGTTIEFKNSWGSAWGDAGYGYLTEAYWTRYGRAARAMAAA